MEYVICEFEKPGTSAFGQFVPKPDVRDMPAYPQIAVENGGC
jgi:hypothetical protein